MSTRVASLTGSYGASLAPRSSNLCSHRGRSFQMGNLALRNQFSLCDLDNPFDVTASTVESALVLEPLLSWITSEVIDPAFDDRHCICPKYYAQLWA